MRCPLCESPELRPVALLKETRNYHDCVGCGFRFLDPDHRLSPAEEKERYRLHVNDPAQEGYRAYCAPLVDAVAGAQELEATGLDFGAGPDSAAYRMLLERGFRNITRYDRFFFPDEAALSPGKYDFIYACEVVEHFHEPRAEFARLRTLLKPGGTLTLMTSLLTPQTDFETWHYRRDPTHIGFYSALALGTLARGLGFADPVITGTRTVSLRRGSQA